MEYISNIWKISTLIYTVLSMVEYVLTQPMILTPEMMGGHTAEMMGGHKAPVLDTTEVTEELIEGKTAVFKCIGSNMEKSEITWLKGDELMAIKGDIILNDDRYSINKISNTGQEYFRIANVTVQDNSYYSCLLDAFPPIPKQFRLYVKALPRIDKSYMIDRFQFVQGGTKTLKCKATGNPPPLVKWYFYGSNSDNERPETRELKSSSENLILRNLSKKDEGIYRCEASNELGKDMYEIYFQEVYKPRVYTPSKQTVSRLGSMTAIQCEVESSPVPNQIRWQRNDTFIEDSWKYQIHLYAESETKQLTVLNIMNTELSDSGMYICIAANDLGRDNVQLFVIVEDPSSTTIKQITPPKVMVSSTTPKPILTEKSTIGTIDKLIKTTEAPEQIQDIDTPRTEASSNNGAQFTGQYLVILCTIIKLIHQIL